MWLAIIAGSVTHSNLEAANLGASMPLIISWMVKNRANTAQFIASQRANPIVFVLTHEVLHHHQLSVKCLLKFLDTTLDVPTY